MTAAHFIYIPLAITVGLIVGYALGGRAARAELERIRARLEEAERREAAARLSGEQTKS
ncbi:MAG: hypothetical protein IT371_04540 [Deltaproteobacteria bacterium]|nr:hypothetical protein [Deltaproteobacteria bacterium]